MEAKVKEVSSTKEEEKPEVKVKSVMDEPIKLPGKDEDVKKTRLSRMLKG